MIVTQEIKALMKSPGGWFFASNAVLYTQTDPLIAVIFMTALVMQRLVHHYCYGKHSNPFLNLIVGAQGILAVNAIMTLSAAALTAIIASPVLAAAGFAFGTANLTQSVVYNATVQTLRERTRHMILVACEFSMALGFALIAVNAGYSFSVSFGLIIPVLAAGVVRTFRSHWLPSGFAYADLMLLSLMTCCEAFLTGNIANGASRILVLLGLSRLAVLRAHNEGKKSVFEVERILKL